MPVVFDEVIGQVEPERVPVPAEPQPNLAEPKESDPQKLRQALRRVEMRAERLRAD